MDEINHHIFHSMGIPVHITLVGVNEIDARKYVADAEQIFQKLDEHFSRFRETSELHKLNTANGAWTSVSLLMLQVLKKCVALAKETGGAFDPSVGGVLASYGYGLPENFTPPSPLPTYKNIEINEGELSIRLLPGQVLEPASIIKGMAIDEAGRTLIDAGASGFLINAGGDIVTHGVYKGDSSWNIAIQDPRNLDAIVGAVALKNAGMATSGTYKTKGVHKGEEWHHLVDMRTGKPSGAGTKSATVIANSCEEADTEASLAILLSETEAIARLNFKGLPYFLINNEGKIIKSAAFAALEVPIQSLIP
ncbi:MAG: FAD:protein FMN transferase [Candidatus Yonathbacteria bacterium]|nr:FAD:protein FMN transferase [Candidatus Yonathbacteria bacterium]